MLARLPARLFVEWMAYFEIEPWGEMVADARNASLMALLANIHRGEHQTAYRIEDFQMMREPQTWQDQKTLFEALTSGLPARDSSLRSE